MLDFSRSLVILVTLSEQVVEKYRFVRTERIEATHCMIFKVLYRGMQIAIMQRIKRMQHFITMQIS